MFALSLALEVYVAVRVRMRLDWAMIVIALAYLVSFLFRTSFFPLPDAGIRLLNATASLVIQAIMYFFVFEMKRYQD